MLSAMRSPPATVFCTFFCNLQFISLVFHARVYQNRNWKTYVFECVSVSRKANNKLVTIQSTVGLQLLASWNKTIFTLSSRTSHINEQHSAYCTVVLFFKHHSHSKMNKNLSKPAIQTLHTNIVRYLWAEEQ